MRFREEATIKTVTETEDFSYSSVFKCISAAFQQVLNVHPNLFAEKHYLFAGRRARIRVVGKRLAESIFLPFSHLQIKPSNFEEFQLTVDLWDEDETGIQCPAELKCDESTLYRTVTASPDSRFLKDQGKEVLISFDRKSKHMICALTCAESLTDRSKPLNRLLALWYKDRGIPIIHAGLVASNDCGVLIAAASRGGKSTLTMVCLNSGFDFLGDDQVGIEAMTDGSFVGHNLYNSICLKHDHLKNLFPQFLNVSRNNCSDKSVVFLSQVLPDRIRNTVPIRALVLPQIVHAPHSRIYQATKGEALSIIASNLLPTMLGFDALYMERIAALVKKIPVYRFKMGHQMKEIPDLIRQLISEVAQK